MAKGSTKTTKNKVFEGRPPAPQPFPRPVLAGIAIGLVLACVLIYAQTAGHGFINYDDPNYLLNNTKVNRGITGEGLIWAFTAFDFYYWQPLTWISHMIDSQLFGLNAGPHHVMSLVLHAANVALLFLALLQLTRAPGCSAFAAGLFGLHPLRVESVAWAAERKDVLSGLFWMLTLLAYSRYARQPERRRFFLVMAAFLGAVMSKPSVVTLPFVLLLLDAWPLGRLQSLPDLRERLKEKLPLFAIIGAASLLTFVGQDRMGATVSLKALPFWFRIWNAIVSYVDYLAMTVWPVNLGVLYPYGKISGAEMASALLLLLAISGFVIWRRHSSPYLFTGWFWYVGALVPMIGLAQTGVQARADRFTYLPSIGLAIFASWGLAEIAARLRVPFPVRAGAVGLVLGLLSFISLVQTTRWKDSFTLFEHTVKVTRDNDVMHLNLADLYQQRRDLAKALPHYEAALRIEPGNIGARRLYAGALAQAGRNDEARQQLESVLQRDPNDAESRMQLMMLGPRR